MNREEKIQIILNHKRQRRRIKVEKYDGDKTSKICPRCGEMGYGFHHWGRIKSCTICGFCPFMELRVRIAKQDIEWSREIVDLDDVVEYIQEIKPLEGD